MREGQPSGVLDLGRLRLKLNLLRSSFLFYLYLKFSIIRIVLFFVFCFLFSVFCFLFFFVCLFVCLLMIFFVLPNGVADKNAVVPNFSLMNQASLDRILKAEVFVHTDGQLRATHLILDYTPISNAFQALKCVIKAKDLRLQRISVAGPGFLISGSIPEGTLATGLIPEGIPRVTQPPQHTAEEGTYSQLALIKEEEEEEIVEVSDSKDKFGIFDQILFQETSPVDLSLPSLASASPYQEALDTSTDIGIQCK